MTLLLLACSQPESTLSPSEVTNSPEIQDEEGPDFWEQHGDFHAGIRLNHVPQGAFTMGIEMGEPDWALDHEPHQVTLSQDIWVSETEVTHEQWLAYMDYHPSQDDPITYGMDMECLDCPVHSVSWDEMLAFANTMSVEHGLEPCFACTGEGADVTCAVVQDPYTCEGYRVPTEAEWEWAAMGGEAFTYPGSEDINAIGLWEENSGMVPHPVCSMETNGYGLCDMGGNIREFTLDWYAAYEDTDVENPYTGPEAGAYAAERGGSWACRRPELRVDRRNLVFGYERDIHSGFRLARTVHPDESL